MVRAKSAHEPARLSTYQRVHDNVERWYWENRDELPEPDGAPKLGLRDKAGG
jgi:hypothetical protein